jgi:hypothetical protein
MARRRTRRSRSRKATKDYGVRFSVPLRPLEHADIKFEVSDREGLLGRLFVSRGAIEWQAYDKKAKRKFTWRKFDEFLYR